MPYKLYCKILIFAFVAIIFASCASQKRTVAHTPKIEQEDIINYGKKYLHKPYRYAAKGPGSFDCSGFTSFVFKEFGYNLNTSSAGQSLQGKAINQKKELQVGDLVFFEGRSHNGRVGHVGIVSEVRRNGNFKFLHASTQHGVIFSSSEEPYYKARYLRGSRILQDASKGNKNSNQKQASESSLTQKSTVATPSNFKEAPSTLSSQEKSTQLTYIKSGTLAIHTHAVDANEKDVSITPDPTNKPVKRKKSEDDEKKEPDLKSQIATTLSEESILPAPIKTTHVVKPGETLFSISKKYNCSLNELQEWNPTIEDNLIQAGDKLRINK